MCSKFTMTLGYAFLVVFLFMPCVLHGQHVAPDTLASPRWVLKLAPLSIIDIDPTLQGGVEYRYGPNASVQQELGFLRLTNWINNIGEERPRSVFRARTEVRWYMSKRSAAPHGFYLAVEGFFKYISQPREGEVNQGSYFETMRYRLVKQVAGGHFKVGGQTYLGSSRLMLDGYIGFGLRTVRLKATSPQGLVNSVDFESLDVLNISDGRTRYSVPSFTMGLKLGYVLLGKKAALPVR